MSDVICRKLLQELTQGIYKDAEKIPAEVEIAAQLGVSRTILRDALSALEREGFISRKHGVGTIVNRHVLAVDTRMDLEEEFFPMIAKTGKTPKQQWTKISFCPAPEEAAAILHIEPGSPIIQVGRLITVDDVPAIYCIDRLSQSLIQTPDYDPSILEAPIFNFINECCKTEVYMDLTEVQAVSADTKLAEYLQIQPGDPVLHMNEVGYSFRGHPILSSLEYYRDGVLKHTMLRKKI